MRPVKAKKHLGQHFLTDQAIAEETVDAFALGKNFTKVLEVGPGMGVLTKPLLRRSDLDLFVIDIDIESIAYLKEENLIKQDHIIAGDFLKQDLKQLFGSEKFGIIGNFPYNISSQILFKALDYKDQAVEVVGMFQKEVAERIASLPGSKAYGIISVLLQAYYDIDYLFTVEPEVFDPPPKVKSAVIRLRRNQKTHLDCNEKFFKTVIKSAFNQRRKTLRNSLRPFIYPEINEIPILNQRPEQLSVEDFVMLSNLLEKNPLPNFQ